MSTRTPTDIPEAEGKRHRGRTRSKEAEEAVLDAAYALLSEHGLQATTVDAIATRSKVSKATIYKWWPNRAAIIMSAFRREAQVATPYPDRLSLDTVIDRVQNMSAQFRGPLGRMMAALIAEGQSDPALAEAFREDYIRARREEGVRIVRLSIEQGIVRKADPEVILDVLYAPLYYRLMVGHQALSPQFVREYLDLAMHGVLNSGAKLDTDHVPTKRKGTATSSAKSKPRSVSRKTVESK
jgi:AcrR family transcriptional regulator